jgi:hypothetical protein
MIGIYQHVNAHAPAIHWWLASDPRFGPQIYEGRNPNPDNLAIGNIVSELRADSAIDTQLYNSHQESLRMMENKRENNGSVDCLTDYFKFNNKFEYPVWSNYFGCCDNPQFAPQCEKLIVAKATTKQSAMFYISQYAFNRMPADRIDVHTKIWWEDHMLMAGKEIGKWKEVWYRDYHQQCIQDATDGKLQYMWQLNFAHWDLYHAQLDGNNSFKLDYSFHRLFERKHETTDEIAQDLSLSYIKNYNRDHLVIDVEWFKKTDKILDYLGVSNSQILKDTAKLYHTRYYAVKHAYKKLYNKYYKGE